MSSINNTVSNPVTIYVGMDVHTTMFTICGFDREDNHYSKVECIPPTANAVDNYLDKLRGYYGSDTIFICGYESGNLGYSLARDLLELGINCVIMAASTIAQDAKHGFQKNDTNDALTLAKRLAWNEYHPVYILDENNEAVREIIRYREVLVKESVRVKQNIMAFCHRHGIVNNCTKSNFTIAHIDYLSKYQFKNDDYKSALDHYLGHLKYLLEKIQEVDNEIEEIAKREEYKEKVEKLCCFKGIKTRSALSFVTEVGDFSRFDNPKKFASYLGLNPGEHSSNKKGGRLGISKAGNSLLRKILIESSQCYLRTNSTYKSSELKKRQSKCSKEIIAYADKGNVRLYKRYHYLIREGKNSNVAKTAVAREFSCFIWGMMNDQIAS